MSSNVRRGIYGDKTLGVYPTLSDYAAHTLICQRWEPLRFVAWILQLMIIKNHPRRIHDMSRMKIKPYTRINKAGNIIMNERRALDISPLSAIILH